MYSNVHNKNRVEIWVTQSDGLLLSRLFNLIVLMISALLSMIVRYTPKGDMLSSSPSIMHLDIVSCVTHNHLTFVQTTIAIFFNERG